MMWVARGPVAGWMILSGRKERTLCPGGRAALTRSTAKSAVGSRETWASGGGAGVGYVWTRQWECLAGLCLELLFSPGNRRPGRQLRWRMRGLRERRYGKVGALMH